MIEYNRLPQYEIIKHVTDGGSSHIYLVGYANDYAILKIAKDHSYTNKLQLYNEADLLSQLNHDSIPKLLSFHEVENKPAIMMTLMKGLNLKYAIEQKNIKFTWQDTVNMVEQLIEIISYLHHRDPSIVVRDIKPSNIIFDEQLNVKLVDFGTSSNHTNEIHNKAFGTKGYAPPEQYKNGCVDKRSDVYAIGATMLYIYTGQFIDDFVSDGKKSYLAPAKFWGFINKATQFEMINRYQNIEEMYAEIKKVEYTFIEKIKNFIKTLV